MSYPQCQTAGTQTARTVIACDKREAFAQGSSCDEAIQTFFAARWIASLALAMTRVIDTPSPSRGAMRPRFAQGSPSKTEGAGNAGCALHPRSRAQRRKWMRARAYRLSGGIRHPLRNGFTAYAALSSAIGLVCHRHLQIKSANLTPASGRQDHTVLPYAQTSFVLRAWPSLTRLNSPRDCFCAPTLSRPPHPVPRS